MKKISINLTEKEYQQLEKHEGKNTSEKIRNLINPSSNYFTRNMIVEGVDFSQYNVSKQTLIAIGVLIRKVYGNDVPEKILKDYVPKFNKGNVLPLYRRVYSYIVEIGELEKYDELLSFISSGLLELKEDSVDDVGYYRVIGETLAKNFNI